MKKFIIILLLFPVLAFGQGYTLDGITIEQKVTIDGIKYLDWGDVNDPVIIYLHGQGERGTDPLRILNQSPIKRKYLNGVYVGWEYPEFFTQELRIICPLLPTTESTWSIAYIDKFLDALLLTKPKVLMGWSLGGGGVERYLNQDNPKYKFECAFTFSAAYSTPGTKIKTPIRISHATNDGTVNVSQSDSFYAGVPTEFKQGYDRPSGGGHYTWANWYRADSGFYQWLKSYLNVVPEVTYQPGVIELGSDGKLYLNINGTRTLLKLN